MHRLYRTFSIALAVAVGAVAYGAAPQAAAQEEPQIGLEEIVVTARKREESLQEVPVSITAFSAEDIFEKDMLNLEDVGLQTPGFQFVNQGNQQPGRYNTQLQFRGLTTAQFSPSFATGALFIDGVYVLNGGTSLTLMDLQRVEVIKGPQAAYFGRNTFGGAVNLITREPSTEEWGGSVRLRTTDRSNNEFNAFVEGPIVQDRLSVSLGGRFFDKQGHYTASSGDRTGSEETQTLSAVVFFAPLENFDIKLRYSRSEDDDSAPTQAYISGLENDSCTGQPATNPLATSGPKNYVCGEVPYNANPVSIGGGTSKLISSNTFIETNLAWDRNGRAPGLADHVTQPSTYPPQIQGLPNITRMGLARETERLSLAANLEVADFEVGFVYGRNEQDAVWIRDFDLSDRQNWFSRDPQMMEDESWEVRISSPQEQRLRYLAGYSYYEQEFSTSGTGGDAFTLCLAIVPGLSNTFPGDCFTPFGPFRNNLTNSDLSEVSGLFFAVDFDITDSITAIVEGRWVEDQLTKGGPLSTNGLASGLPSDSETFDEFLPRIILRWTPSESTNIYASYSEGLLAGDFNTFFAQATTFERDQYVAINPNIAELLPAETLEAIELGWKQSFAGGRAQVNLSIYRQEWLNIKGRSSYTIREECRVVDPANCPDESFIGQPKIDAVTGLPFFNSRNILVPGDAEIQGLEVELSYLVTENLLLQGTASFIDSEYTDYEYNFVVPITGYSQMRGNKTPRQAQNTFTASATYSLTLAGREAYIRGDAFHQGKAYVDEGNLAWLSPYTLINLRVGVNVGQWMAELFIDNAFDEEAWQTGARWTDFSRPTQFASLTGAQGIAVSPLDRREFGLRLEYRF